MYSEIRKLVKLLMVGLLFTNSNALSITVYDTYVNHVSGPVHVHLKITAPDKQVAATPKPKRCHKAGSAHLCKCENCNNCELSHCATTLTITSAMPIHLSKAPSQNYSIDFFGIAAAHSLPPYKPPIAT